MVKHMTMVCRKTTAICYKYSIIIILPSDMLADNCLVAKEVAYMQGINKYLCKKKKKTALNLNRYQ